MSLLDYVKTLPTAGTLAGTEQVGVIGSAGIPVQTTTQAIADLATTEANEIRLSVYNGTGGTLSAGTLLYVNGWNAANSVDTVAKADTDVQGAWAVWVTRAALTDATVGWVYKTATLTAQSTGSTTIGDPYYLSTTAGAGTKTAPTTGVSRRQVIGRITTVNASTGTVDVDLLAEAPFLTVGSQEIQTTAALAVASVTADGATPQLVIGKVAASSTGAVDFKGLTSGTTRLTVPDAAGSVTVTLPTQTTVMPTAQPVTNGDSLVATTGGTWSFSPRAALGVRVGTQYLTSGTAASYTATAGATIAVFNIVGAGGGGGGAAGGGAGTQFGVGGGGGGGGFAQKTYTTLTGITYTIGAGGAGGTAGNNAGSAGGDTSSTQSAVAVTAKGGSGGASIATGVTLVPVTGGAGGAISTNGDLNAGGQAGGFGYRGSTAPFCIGGIGGGSHFGGGALGAAPGGAVGAAAAVYGGGGGGATTDGTTDRAGGAGSGGLIVVEEFR